MIKRWLVLLLLFFCSHSVLADDNELLKIVERNARTWLGLIDEAKYQESWESASPLFKQKKSVTDWVKTMTVNRSPRGAASVRYIATAGSAKSLSGFPDGEYIVLQFYATFQKGLALETVTLTKSEESDWLIADYTIK